MSKNNKINEIREPGEIGNIDEIMNDPLISNPPKEDKEHTKFKTNIITDSDGKIPDIPEQSTENITVDFSQEEENHINSELSGQNNEGKQYSDIADDTKVDMSTFAGNLMFAGFELLNDFAVNKFVINEDKLKELAINGEIPFEVIEIKIQFGADYIFDMKEFLNKQEEKIRDSLAFSNQEKKYMLELLSDIFKSKKFKMTPEGALFWMIVTHYGTSCYHLYSINEETKKWLEIISNRIVMEKEQTSGKPGKRNAMKKDEEKESTVESEKISGNKASDETIIGEIREPGEVKKPKNGAATKRKAKRTVNLNNIEIAEAQIV